MIYKTIPIVERADGSLQIDARNINLRQGDYNFKLQYSTNKDYSEYSPIVNVQVAFRRKDGQQTGWLPLQHIRANEYSINLKNTWFTKEAGILYMTFRVFQTSDTNVQLIINTASASLPITPIAQFNPEEEDLLPSEFEVFQSQVNERLEDAVYNDNSTLKTFTGSTINPKTVATQVTTTRGNVQSDINQLYNDISFQKLGKGIFDTEQELLSQYPNGSDFPEGTWAVLLSTNTVWLYNSQTKQWYNSTRTITDIFELDDKVYKFAKELMNDSLNLFKAELLQGIDGIVVEDSGKTIKMPIVTGGNGSINTHIKLKDFCPDMVAGKTYYLKYTRNYNDNNNFIYLGGSASFWWNPGSKVITQEDLDGYLYVYTNRYTSGFTEQIIMTDFIIVEGSTSESLPSEWKPYNPNRHITNSEAEFLKEEYEKSKNKFNINGEIRNNHATHEISGNQITVTGMWYAYAKVDVKPNTDYYLSVTPVSHTFVSNIAVYDDAITTSLCPKYNNTFNTGNRNIVTLVMYCGAGSGNEGTSVYKNIQLEEGTIGTSYEEWNGKLIHEKDITPVLLWKNATPNAEFTEQTITLSESLNNYEYINILYKQVGSVDSEPVIHKIKNLKTYGTNYSSTLSWCGGTTTQSTNTRAMTIPTDTSIKFGGGYRNNAILNTIIVPYEIYGSNY